MKTSICTIALLGIIALFSPGARAVIPSFTTNYDVLNIAVIVVTNSVMIPSTNVQIFTNHKVALDNAAILGLLEGPDWYNASFPAGSKLVVSWDAGHNVSGGNTGDILVIDKTGTVVLYDASRKSWSHSGKATMTVNSYYEEGAYNANLNLNNAPGNFDFTLSGNTTFQIYDGANTTNLALSTIGPSTEVYKQAWKNETNGVFTGWSDSVHASTYGVGSTNIINNDSVSITVSVKISASGHGPGEGGYYEYLNP